MSFEIAGFILFVLACLIYLHKDKTEWKLMGDRLCQFTAKFNGRLSEISKQSSEAEESNKALRSSLMAQKVTTDNLQDHCHRLQQSLLQLEGKYRIIQDQVVGFKVNLPENISVSFTKDVKNAANRHKQKGSKEKKQDRVLRSKKPKPGANTKRHVGVSANR